MQCALAPDLLWNLRVVLSVWYPVPQPGLTFTQQFESLIQLDQDIYHYVSAGFHLWARTTCIHWEVVGPQWEDACFFCPTIYHRNCLSTPHPSPFVFLPFPSPDQNIYLDRNAIWKSHDFFKAGTKKQVEISVFMYNTSGNHCGNIWYCWIQRLTRI